MLPALFGSMRSGSKLPPKCSGRSNPSDWPDPSDRCVHAHVFFPEAISTPSLMNGCCSSKVLACTAGGIVGGGGGGVAASWGVGKLGTVGAASVGACIAG